MNRRTALPRQLFFYVLIGLAQLALDTAVYVALTAAGVPVTAGNVAGRVSAAGFGFLLNGRYTFTRDGESALRGRHLWRYVVMWSTLTLVGTLALAWIADVAGLQGSWLAKPVLEGLLAVVSFVVQRQWVYR